MKHGLRAAALLLDYPSAALLEHLDEIGAAARTLPGSTTVLPLVQRLANADLIDLQETYGETFDRGRRTSLNLFEHVHGDSRDRGQAMVDLLQMYRDRGVVLDCDQLPDYLPAFLAYCALLEPAAARAQLAEIAHILQAIRAALARRRSDYAGVLEALLAAAGVAIEHDTDAGEDDTTPAAIDAAWVDAPVNFLDAPCPTQPAHSTQTIHVHRRAA